MAAWMAIDANLNDVLMGIFRDRARPNQILILRGAGRSCGHVNRMTV
jgi:hypothetical protein